MESTILKIMSGTTPMDGVVMATMVLLLWRVRGVETRLAAKLDNGISSLLGEIRERLAKLEARCLERSSNKIRCK